MNSMSELHDYQSLAERLLMSRRFRRWIEAWIIVTMPWVLLLERPAVSLMGQTEDVEEN